MQSKPKTVNHVLILNTPFIPPAIWKMKIYLYSTHRRGNNQRLQHNIAILDSENEMLDTLFLKVDMTDSLQRIAEAQARGIIASSESHGAETPGHVSAAADAAREAALLVLSLWAILMRLQIDINELVIILALTTVGWTLWKFGRSAWLGWTRLERLHRLVAEERWEIEHHRQQERDELRVLYEAKGFRGTLLDEAVEVLMADGDRLLRVMIEEELGLSLEVHEHPVKQGLGAAGGALIAGLWCALCVWLLPGYGILLGTVSTIGSAAGISAYLERNHIIPAIVWNLGIAALAFSTIFFLLDLFGIKG